MPYNVNNRSITIFKLSVSFVYLLLLICYSFGVAVTGLDLILFSELFNLIVFPFNELSRSPVITLFCCTVSSLQEFIWILYWQCMYCAALCWSKPYQVRRGRNTKCSSPVFYQHVVQFRQLSVFFCPFSTTVSLHGWFPAWFGSLCCLDFVENICNLASAAVPWWSWSRLESATSSKVQVSGGKRLSAQVTVHNFVEYITSLRVLSFASSCLGPGVLQNLKIICENWAHAVGRGNKYEIWFEEKSCWKMLKMEVTNWA